MKQIFRFAAIVAAIAAVLSCQKEEGTKDKGLKAPVVTVSPEGKIILSEDSKDAEALTISWTSVADDADYTLHIAPAKAADYSSAYTKTTKATEVAFTTEELQQILLGFEYAPGDNVTMRVMVKAVSGDKTVESTDARVQCVLYAHIVDLNTPVLTLSNEALILVETEKDADALTVTWTDASVEDVYVDYVFEWTLSTDTDFAAATKANVADAREYKMTGAALQYSLIDLGYKAGETASLICRVTAEPANGNIEPVVSDVKAFSVTLYEKPKNENIPTSVVIVGNAVENGWDNGAESAMFTDKGEGVFEWTGLIKNIDTFKFLFDGSWSIGLRPGAGDYYWIDIAYANPMVDNDYFRLLIPGTWKFVLDTYNVSADLTLVETSIDNVYLNIGETETAVPVKDKTKAVFEGNVNFVAGEYFVIYSDLSDKSRSFVCHPSSNQNGPTWKMAERREPEQDNTNFCCPDSGEYKVTIDLLNHTMTAVAL